MYEDKTPNADKPFKLNEDKQYENKQYENKQNQDKPYEDKTIQVVGSSLGSGHLYSRLSESGRGLTLRSEPNANDAGHTYDSQGLILALA